MDGKTYRGQDWLDGATKAAAIRTRTVTVTYLPKDPAICCTGSPQPRLQDHKDTVQRLDWMVSVGCALGLVLFELGARRELRLARRGEVALGRVIGRTGSTDAGRNTFKLRYQIDIPGQAGQTAWINLGRTLWETLHNSSLITVLYDPDNLGHHRPTFGFRFVRFPS